MATHSSILAWRIPWTEEPGGLWSWNCEELDIIERLILSLSHIHADSEMEGECVQKKKKILSTTE